MKQFAIACLLGLVSSHKLARPIKIANAPYDAWNSVDGGSKDGLYERVLTPQFSTSSDDIFMRSMIQKYAVEEREDSFILADGKKVGGEPTGNFWMTQSTAMKAAKEVLKTHKGLSGETLDAYLDTYFQRAWDHYDPIGAGQIEVIKMPQFMRLLASDQRMSLSESG